MMNTSKKSLQRRSLNTIETLSLIILVEDLIKLYGVDSSSKESTGSAVSPIRTCKQACIVHVRIIAANL